MSKVIPICPTWNEKWYKELVKGMEKRTVKSLLVGSHGFNPNDDKTLYYTGLPPLKSRLSFMLNNIMSGKHCLTDMALAQFIRPRLSHNDIPKTYKFEYWEPDWNQPGLIDFENEMFEMQLGTLGVFNSNKCFYPK